MYENLPRCPEPIPRHAGVEKHGLPDPRWVLFLDVDGALLHRRERPGVVKANGCLRYSLKTVGIVVGDGVALVGNCRIEYLDRLFVPVRLRAAGLHGPEPRHGDNAMGIVGDVAVLESSRRSVRDFSGAELSSALEDKDRGHALAYCGSSHLAEECRALVRLLTAGRRSGLQVIDSLESLPGRIEVDEPERKG